MRPYDKEDYFRMKWLHSAEINPSATHAAYTISEYDANNDADVTNLWLVEIASGEHRQLTFGNGTDASPSWSPDGKTIAFLSNRSGKVQVWLISAETNTATQLTTLPNGVAAAPTWSPDGKHISFTARQQENEPGNPNKPYRVTRNVYRFDGLGYVHRALNDIYVVDATSHALTRLTDSHAVNGNLRWSPDSTKLLFTRSLDGSSFVNARPNVCCVDLNGNETTRISVDQFSVSSIAWHSDSQRIIFSGSPHGTIIGSKSDLYVTDLNGGEPHNRTLSLPMGVNGRTVGDMPAKIHRAMPRMLVSADGKSAYVEVQRGGDVEINRITLEGAESVEPILYGERRLRLLGIDRDEQHISYLASDINTPADLHVCGINGGNEQQLTATNAHILPELETGTVRRLLYPSIDGVQVEGWHIAPDDSDTAWPTIVYIHGGPHSAFGNQYRFDTHMLLGAGFAVLIINHRASIGYNDAFATGIFGDWGNLEYQDTLYGVDYAIAQGLTDPDRLGVTGMSGGGYLSCWIVTQTDRFKAAVPENPVTNWISMYGVSDASVWLAVEEFGGHPYEIPEKYTQFSPITHAHNCKTPTLLIQGEHDWRCPAEQSEQFYTVLKVHGCPVEMVRLPNASHFGSIDGSPATRRAQNDGLLAWMVRYVL